jgi:bifunctional enzyme CysN/CysC
MDTAVRGTFGEALPERTLLRFLTCGSVDDGKSTLLGRLLVDSSLVSDDQMAALARDSAGSGTAGDDPDFALLMDGLQDERDQRITIDVAYRHFATPSRAFVVADTPGHEQYTRNMATGASTAQLAVILVDARKGVLVQTRRHSLICALLGIRRVVLAVNKMDLVNFSEQVFERISCEYRVFAAELGFATIVPIPVSARFGDNVVARSHNMPWYTGPALLQYLESVELPNEAADTPFRLPVQWVNRPNPDFRGYAGTIAAGRIRVGDSVVAATSGQTSRIKSIVTYDGSLPAAEAGDAVTVALADEIDVGRGEVLASPEAPPEVSDQFAAHVIWLDSEALVPGRSYLARIGTKTTPVTVTTIKYRIDPDTREHLAANTLELNHIAFCNLATGERVAFDPYADNRKTGSFILIDRITNRTIGAGMIAFGLRRGANLRWQELLISKAERAGLKNQKPVVIWFTGLSGAGKSTIANGVEQRLHAGGYHTMLLDGDNVRHGLNRDLGFTEADRVENIRRAGEVARLMAEAGLIVLCSFISPYRAERELVRNLVPPGDFIEVFVDTPLEECMRRDPKGLYVKAKSGAIKNFTGFDAPYEIPNSPDIHLHTLEQNADQAAEYIVADLVRRGIVSRR